MQLINFDETVRGSYSRQIERSKKVLSEKVMHSTFMPAGSHPGESNWPESAREVGKTSCRLQSPACVPRQCSPGLL